MDEKNTTDTSAGIKVLLVEDDAFISDLVTKKLIDSGITPNSVTNGNDVLSTAEKFMPDVVVLDLTLPGLQGEDILQQLKSNLKLKDIPVIVFSNRSDDEEIQKLLAMGATKFFVKVSTELDELIAEIRLQAKRTP